MKLIEQLNQLNRLDALIRKRATGTPKDMARRFTVSERTIYNLLETLRGLGAEIDYCRIRESYYYRNEIKFHFDLVVKGTREGEIKGGAVHLGVFSDTANFLHEKPASLSGSYDRGMPKTLPKWRIKRVG